MHCLANNPIFSPETQSSVVHARISTPGHDQQSGPIYYFCTRQHAYTMGVLLGYYQHGLGDLVRIIPYELAARLGPVAPGTFIFTDFERLAPAQLQAAVPFMSASPRSIQACCCSTIRQSCRAALTC